MIDNYDKISKYTHPRYRETDPTVFYMFQVLQRKKDGFEHEHTVRIAYGDFYDKEFMDHLRRLTVEYNARTYMKLNRCYDGPVALRTMARMAEMIAEGNMAIRNCYDSICGQYKPKEDTFWIIDIDSNQVGSSLDWTSILKAQEKTKQEPVMGLIDTPNGYHLITRPFNPADISMGVEVIKKNPITILFSSADQDKSKLPVIGWNS